MTALEKKKRQQEKRKSTIKKSLGDFYGSKRKKAIVNHDKRIRRGFMGAFTNAITFGSHKKSAAPPQIQPLTLEVMQVVVESILADRKSPCTVRELANALVGSKQVIDTHAESTDDKTAMNFLETRFMGMTFRRGQRRINKEREYATKRRYEWVNAMNKLQVAPGAATDTLESWDEARAVLATVLSLPEEEEQDDEEKKTDEITTSDSADEMNSYKKRLRAIQLHQKSVGLTAAQHLFQKITTSSLPSRETIDKEDALLNKQLEEEYQKRDERLKVQAVEDLEERLQQDEREQEARELASSLMRPLTDEEIELVNREMNKIAPGNEVIAQVGTDSIQRESLRRLQPSQWLNDEVIHYFLIMLQKRDEELCEQDPKRKRSHFFKSFFMTKLRNEGHTNPAMDGQYEYRNVKRWSKKVPGKDIFQLDKIIFPINQGQMHWVCAVAYMQEKRIQFYDSMGDDGMEYLEDIFRYIKDEHQDKKKCPLPDAESWQLVPCTGDTPRQLNGFDCGVFTCMFADFLSKDCPLVFGQDHVTQCRHRIALSILKGKAIM